MNLKGIMLRERSQSQKIHLCDVLTKLRDSGQIRSFQKLGVGRGCDSKESTEGGFWTGRIVLCSDCSGGCVNLDLC